MNRKRELHEKLDVLLEGQHAELLHELIDLFCRNPDGSDIRNVEALVTYGARLRRHQPTVMPRAPKRDQIMTPVSLGVPLDLPGRANRQSPRLALCSSPGKDHVFAPAGANLPVARPVGVAPSRLARRPAQKV